MHAGVGLRVGPEKKADRWRQVIPYAETEKSAKCRPLHGNEGQAMERRTAGGTFAVAGEIAKRQALHRDEGQATRCTQELVCM